SDRALDLRPVADDGRVREQPIVGGLSKARDRGRVEVSEGLAVGIPFAKDRHPAQPRLRALEDQEFKQQAVVVDGDAPLAVVVFEHQGIALPPAAPLNGHAPSLPSPASGGEGSIVRWCRIFRYPIAIKYLAERLTP